MTTDLDELQKLELKEAFDEFDKVIFSIQSISYKYSELFSVFTLDALY